MDDGSEAETAASLQNLSDAAQTVNSATYTDPYSLYPHPQSLPSPVGIAPERSPGEDIAIQYVTAKAGELRFLKFFEFFQFFEFLKFFEFFEFFKFFEFFEFFKFFEFSRIF